jgi:phospholipase C
MTEGVLGQIGKVVVLMLENRSLDNVLGWLHCNGDPINIWPPGDLPQHYDGIPPGAVNFKHRTPWSPSCGHGALGAQRWRVPRWDPHEGIAAVQVQMYGDADGFISDRNWGQYQTMGGFAVDFPTPQSDAVGDVMGAYSSAELPVLYGLAKSFAVSDRWFGSVPSETDPNRAFSLCGTAEGIEYALQDHVFASPTLFNALNTSVGSSAPKTWCIYYQDEGRTSMGPRGSICYTQGRFRQVGAAIADSRGRGAMAPYESLLETLRSGNEIPDFCYVEPSWGWGWGLPDGTDFIGFQGNDYHPPAWVGPAEWDLNELYVALRASPYWEQMLFVVTFDEHGGCWDHVATPRAVPPDATIGHPVRFGFDRMGPRVPTILVSPYVAPRTVFRAPSDSLAAFDHTSLSKTVLRWAGADPGFTAKFGARFARAPSFEGVLASTIAQPEAPLDFHPPESFRTQCVKGPHNIPFDAASLNRDDHAIAAAESSTVDEYVTALRRRAEM